MNTMELICAVYSLDDTARQQQTIRLELLPRSFLAKGWKDVMEQGGTWEKSNQNTK